jgi:hypothetical protein
VFARGDHVVRARVERAVLDARHRAHRALPEHLADNRRATERGARVVVEPTHANVQQICGRNRTVGTERLEVDRPRVFIHHDHPRFDEREQELADLARRASGARHHRFEQLFGHDSQPRKQVVTQDLARTRGERLGLHHDARSGSQRATALGRRRDHQQHWRARETRDHLAHDRERLVRSELEAVEHQQERARLGVRRPESAERLSELSDVLASLDFFRRQPRENEQASNMVGDVL